MRGMSRNERELQTIEKRSIVEALEFCLRKERSKRTRRLLEANLKEVVGELNRLLSRKKGKDV